MSQSLGQTWMGKLGDWSERKATPSATPVGLVHGQSPQKLQHEGFDESSDEETHARLTSALEKMRNITGKFGTPSAAVRTTRLKDRGIGRGSSFGESCCCPGSRVMWRRQSVCPRRYLLEGGPHGSRPRMGMLRGGKRWARGSFGRGGLFNDLYYVGSWRVHETELLAENKD